MQITEKKLNKLLITNPVFTFAVVALLFNMGA